MLLLTAGRNRVFEFSTLTRDFAPFVTVLLGTNSVKLVIGRLLSQRPDQLGREGRCTELAVDAAHSRRKWREVEYGHYPNNVLVGYQLWCRDICLQSLKLRGLVCVVAWSRDRSVDKLYLRAELVAIVIGG